MRLKGYERAAILATVKHFDSNARVYLFGSRADDTKMGGDIDLLLMSGTITGDTKRAIRMRLYEAFGEQKIDIVVAVDNSDPFVQLPLDRGVEL